MSIKFLSPKTKIYANPPSKLAQFLIKPVSKVFLFLFQKNKDYNLGW